MWANLETGMVSEFYHRVLDEVERCSPVQVSNVSEYFIKLERQWDKLPLDHILTQANKFNPEANYFKVRA